MTWAERQESAIQYDRARCGHGAWSAEPDRVEWRTNGVPCLIVRNHMGALCGYAAVAPGHPLHGRGYDVAYEVLSRGVHGGLTYADACVEGGHICHVPLAGEPADVWWFGFDCSHCGDHTPALGPCRGEQYRDVAFVRDEVESLAAQLAEVGARS